MKKLHYIWLGKGNKPKIFEKCLESWTKYCPDWEIVEWNEDNLFLNKYKYAQDAYNYNNNKKTTSGPGGFSYNG